MAFGDFALVGRISDGKTRENNLWFAVVQFQLATRVVPSTKIFHSINISVCRRIRNVDRQVYRCLGNFLSASGRQRHSVWLQLNSLEGGQTHRCRRSVRRRAIYKIIIIRVYYYIIIIFVVVVVIIESASLNTAASATARK